MASRKTLLLAAVSVLGLVGAGCTADPTSNDPNRVTHMKARRMVTGSNVPQAPAYGDGVNDADTRSALGQLNQRSSVSSGGFGGGAVGGGAR